MASPRVSVMMMALSAATGCGAAGSAPPPRAETRSAAPETANAPVLVLGVQLVTGRFAVASDGRLLDDGGVARGRLDDDGTLHREDGSVFARVGRDGSITLEEPSRVTDASFGGMGIRGNALWYVNNGVEEEYERVEGDAIVREGRRRVVEGLTQDYVRTVLAADALIVAMLLESPPDGFF